MQRLLLTALLLSTACGPKFPESVSHPQGSGDDLICNEEVYSPRGTAGLRCRSRRQIENDRRFAKDLKLDPTPRQTYNQ